MSTEKISKSCQVCVFYANEKHFCCKKKEKRNHDDQCEWYFDQADATTTYRPVQKNRRESPRPGEVYRHYKGNRYLILFVAKETSGEREGSFNVVYENYEGEPFTRPIEEFLGYVEKDGEIKERFLKEVGVTWSL